MSKVTFCPHHIINIKNDIVPEVIEKYFIQPLVDFLRNAYENKLTVCVSQSLINEFEGTHPWYLLSDPFWKSWIKDWYGILKPLLTKAEIIEHPISDHNVLTRCCELPQHINKIFDNFLDEIATHTLPNNVNEEAVFTPTPWCNNFNDFIEIKNPEDINLAKFTWYRIYPYTLPCQGEIPFKPPAAWKQSVVPRRGNHPNYGYMDSLNREWVWDLFHNDHWDVQNAGGGRGNYVNVSPDGRKLDND